MTPEDDKPQLMEAEAEGDAEAALVEVPCLVCTKRHMVLVSANNRANWERAMLTRCPDKEAP